MNCREECSEVNFGGDLIHPQLRREGRGVAAVAAHDKLSADAAARRALRKKIIELHDVCRDHRARHRACVGERQRTVEDAEKSIRFDRIAADVRCESTPEFLRPRRRELAHACVERIER